MLLEQTKQHILALGDEELIGYTQAEAGTFTPEVVAFARAELERRNIDPARVKGMAEQAAFRVELGEALQRAKAREPLGTTGRVLSFIAGMCGLPILLLLVAAVRFHERGEQRKNRQMWGFGFAGLGTVMVLFLIEAYL